MDLIKERNIIKRIYREGNILFEADIEDEGVVDIRIHPQNGTVIKNIDNVDFGVLLSDIFEDAKGMTDEEIAEQEFENKVNWNDNDDDEYLLRQA